jgi:serine/threonine protein kinase, bacterial
MIFPPQKSNLELQGKKIRKTADALADPIRGKASLFRPESRSMKQLASPLTGRLPSARSSLPSGLVPYSGCRLRRFRGCGGFGEVWEAEESGGEIVALKFIPCNATNAPREIRSLQQVRQVVHPNLVQIDKIFCCSGYLVVGMELAEGSLQDLLEFSLAESGTPLPAALVCNFLSQMADALDFLNTRQHRIDGQVFAFRHCDVKPSNMLLFGDAVKLADFGVTLMTVAASQTHPRAGTPDYAAPEVFSGKVTDRTDQYALAVSYYVLRTGRLPFADTPGDFRHDYVRPAPDLSPLAPRERPVLARALSPAAMDRWPSCKDMMAQLTRAVQQSGRHRLISIPKRPIGERPTRVALLHDTSAGGTRPLPPAK